MAKSAERRIRFVRTFRATSIVLCFALAVAIVDAALLKLGVMGTRSARAVLGMAGAAVLVSAIVAWTRRLPRHAGARSLDRFYDLHDRLASALAFAEQRASDRTPFMNAAIEDALAAASNAHASSAVPIGLPRALRWAAGLAGLLVAVTFFQVRRSAPAVHAKTIDPVEMSSDDLEDVKDLLKQVEQSGASDETKASVQEFNKLVDDIANKRLDRTEAFRRMGALEERLLTGSEADKKALEDQLDRIGEALKKAELTRPAGEALADRRLDESRAALHELARKFRNAPDKPIDRAKLEQMRAAIQKSVAEAMERQKDLERRRQELADEILRMKEKQADAASTEEQSLLEKKQRELERLDRELGSRKEAGRQLDRLDRELEQAAEDLMKDLGQSAEDLDQGAEDINRLEQQEMTRREKEELRQKLQELRELLRQGGQGGKPQIARLKRFSRMARGQGGSQGQGGESQGSGQDEQQGGSPGGSPGADGDGQGGAKGEGGGETWVLGPNGEKMLMLSKGQRGAGQSGQGDQAGGGEQGSADRRWGEGHDPHLQGKGTNPKMATEDTQVTGGDTGQGGSRSQVILGAAERGFASRGYKRVYTEYHQVAEESLTKDEIPGGYRFYVKRYFQLIRPRESQ